MKRGLEELRFFKGTCLLQASWLRVERQEMKSLLIIYPVLPQPPPQPNRSIAELKNIKCQFNKKNITIFDLVTQVTCCDYVSQWSSATILNLT